MTILDFPYVSQLEDGARKYNNDCGAASGVMLIRAYNNDFAFTVDDYYQETGQREDKYLDYSQIMKVLQNHKIPSTRKIYLKLNDLEQFIKEKRPPIVLFFYKKLLGRKRIKPHKQFKGDHFAVLVGIDDKSVYLNDPLWPGTQGKNFQIPRDIWLEAWENKDENGQRNKPFQAIIPDYPVDTAEVKPIEINSEDSIKMQVVYSKGMNIRSGPGSNYAIVGSQDYEDYVMVYKKQTKGNDVWGYLGEGKWVAIFNSGKTYLEPVELDVDDPGDNGAIDLKDEVSEEHKMGVKRTINGDDVLNEGKAGKPDQKMADPSLAEVMTELKEIKSILMDLKDKMVPGDLDRTEELGSELGADKPQSTTPEENIKTKEIETFTTRNKGKVYLSFVKGENRQKTPVFEFYPHDASKVKDRIIVMSGTKLKVIQDSRLVGDSKRTGWKLDMSQDIPTMKGSARVPSDVQLFIEEKFIKS